MKKKAILSPGQAAVIEKLKPLVDLATSGVAKNLPIRPRTSSLLIGRSGTGKSHLARELARQCNLPFWQANVANWIVLGARGNKYTMSELVNWMRERKSGIIFIDELDKLTGTGDWTGSIRLEIHDLLDGRIPTAALEQPDEIIAEMLSPDGTRNSHAEIENKLKNSFYILGAGTCMQAWTAQKSEIGFNASSSDVKKISRGQILKSMSAEILQRFRADICFLEPLTRNDYLNVASSIMTKIPKRLVEPFAQTLTAQMDKALEQGLGMRIFEEILADLWAAEFAQHRDKEHAWVYLTKKP